MSWLCCTVSFMHNPSHKSIANMFAEYNRTSDGWLEWRGNQYYMNRMSMAMEEARVYCQMKHSDLVTINFEAEAVFLWKQVRNYFSHNTLSLLQSKYSRFYQVLLFMDVDNEKSWALLDWPDCRSRQNIWVSMTNPIKNWRNWKVRKV